MKPASHHHSGHQHNELIQQLIDCAFACENCASSCLDELMNVSIMARCIELDRDCAEICLQAAKLLKRDSEISHHFLSVCGEMCRLCGEECAKYEHDHCKKCAEECMKCADACNAVYMENI
jgi:hypothetical protein